MRWWLTILVLAGCTAPSALPSDAYVWNRRWTPAVRAAIVQRPSSLRALRVLLQETGAQPAQLALDPSALRGAKVIPVLRVGTELPGAASWAQFLGSVEALRAQGLSIEQIEVDFDAAQEALDTYAAWLEATRPSLGLLRRSITALPTWVRSGALPRLCSSVDEVVLQVHTVRAPVLFEPRQAIDDVHRWAQATGRPFRVALPAYRAQLADGTDLAADPREVSEVALALAREPLVSGLVYFRLGNEEDRGAWSLETFEAVLAHQAPARAVLTPRLRAGGPGLTDVWLENDGPIDALAPAHFRVSGTTGDVVATTGYALHDDTFITAHPLWLRPGDHIRVGSARGEDLHVTVP